MKKYIKYVVLVVLLLLVFGIYTIFKTDQLNYIALGDSLAEGMNPYGELGYSYTDYLADYLKKKNMLSFYTKEYASSGYTTFDLMQEIEMNSTLKKDLRESDLVTVDIGANDLLQQFTFDSIDVQQIKKLKEQVAEIFPKIDECMKNIRKYAKEDIVVIGFLFNLNGNDLDYLFAYIDSEYQKICKKYQCSYVSIYQLFKNNSSYLPNPNDIHPNLEGYHAISQEIIHSYFQNPK